MTRRNNGLRWPCWPGPGDRGCAGTTAAGPGPLCATDVRAMDALIRLASRSTSGNPVVFRVEGGTDPERRSQEFTQIGRDGRVPHLNRRPEVQHQHRLGRPAGRVPAGQPGGRPGEDLRGRGGLPGEPPRHCDTGAGSQCGRDGDGPGDRSAAAAAAGRQNQRRDGRASDRRRPAGERPAIHVCGRSGPKISTIPSPHQGWS